MAGQLEYSSTAASNTTINGIGIAGSNSIKNGDDAMRQIMADTAASITKVVDKAAGTYTAVKADFNQLWRATGAVTINLTAAATLTSGWCLWVKADGGAVTVDPAGAEQINGAATLALPDGSSALIICTGSAFRAIVMAGTEEVRVALSQSSKLDTTPNKLLIVGAFGVGAQYVHTEVDMDNYTTPGAYVTPSTGLVNLPPGWPTTGRHIITLDGGVNYASQVIVRTSDGKTARRGYVNPTFSAWVEDIQAYGGTMTGPLTLSGDPTLALHAATKQYVDTEIAAIPGAPAPNYGTGNAALAFGSVGTYALCSTASAVNIAQGGTVAGSNLQYRSTIENGSALQWTSTPGGTPSGTWRNMGQAISNITSDQGSIFLRIS